MQLFLIFGIFFFGIYRIENFYLWENVFPRIDIQLNSSNRETTKRVLKILTQTMEACENIGIQFIEIPLVGYTSSGSNCSFISFVSLYILSTVSEKLARTTLRITLSVGVNSPFSNVNRRSISANSFTRS